MRCLDGGSALANRNNGMIDKTDMEQKAIRDARRFLAEGIAEDTPGIAAIHFEEVRRHLSTDAAHVHGGLLAMLTAWCEEQAVAYQGVPVGTIKRFITGRGNADKAAVMSAVRERGYSPADDNEADAIAILLWALETRGGVR